MSEEALITIPSMDHGEMGNPRGGFIEHKGERIALDQNYWDMTANDGQGGPNVGALAKAVTDLRRQVSSRSEPPETYELMVPEELTGLVKADPDHALAKPAMEWARKNALSQDAFNELTAVFYTHEAATADGHVKQRQEQEKILDQALGADAEKIKRDVGDWFGSLLAQDFKKQPVLRQVLESMTNNAHGVLLIKALKDKISERVIPGGRSEDLGVLTADDLRGLQSSQAYLDQSHPNHRATVDKVREGFQRLYPE